MPRYRKHRQFFEVLSIDWRPNILPCKVNVWHPDGWNPKFSEIQTCLKSKQFVWCLNTSMQCLKSGHFCSDFRHILRKRWVWKPKWLKIELTVCTMRHFLIWGECNWISQGNLYTGGKGTTVERRNLNFFVFGFQTEQNRTFGLSPYV